MQVLIIEDNAKMASFIQRGLAELGYDAETAATGQEGEDLAAGRPFGAIVLDVMLPDKDGVAVCRRLRQRGINTPILMLTALNATNNKVAGLDAGADDYLTKPFEFPELVARLRAMVRRGQGREATMLCYDQIEMDLLTRKVTRAGKKIELTVKEFSLLEFFLRHPRKVLTRTYIGEQVWDQKVDNDSNLIDVYVSMLRRKVDRGYEYRVLHTVVGAGYMLSADPPATVEK